MSTSALGAIDLTSSSDTWSSVLVGDNFDPGEDTQAVAAVDLTGFGSTPLFFMKYDDGGTVADTSDDEVAFRFRADSAVDNGGDFDGYIWIGLDVDADNDIDAFMMLVGKNGVYNLDIYDSGTGENTSPSTTDIDSSSIVHVTTGFTFYHNLINTIDATGDPDMDSDGDPDYLISYKVNFDALAAALNLQSLTGSSPVELISSLNGGSGMTIETPFQLVAASAQNANTLNGDVGGYDDKNDDLSVTYADQGAFSGSISFSNPEPSDTTDPTAPTVTSQSTEDTTPTITGTYDSADAAGGFTVTLNSVTYTLGDGNLSATGDNWSLIIPAGSELPLATYDVVATATDGSGNAATDASTNELVVQDVTAPAAPTVTSQTTEDTTPTITGTYDSADAAGGFTVTLNSVTYTLGDGNLSATGDNWSLTIPAANELPLATYDVTATANDGASNASSDATNGELVINDTTGSTAPTVTSQTTEDTTPTITGTYDSADAAGGFTVTLNSVTYTLGDGNLSATGDNWSLTIPAGNELPLATYDVTATANDGASNASSDATNGELVINDTTGSTAPTVTSQTTEDTTPTITGTYDSADAAGGFTVTLNSVTYTLGDGNLSATGDNWSLIIPAGSELPLATYDVVATATDGSGNAATDASTNELVVQDVTAPAAPTVT